MCALVGLNGVGDNAEMASRDHFKADLRCPKCGLTGEARLSQADGHAFLRGDRNTTVESLPVGFEAGSDKSWVGDNFDVLCSKCHISAIIQANVVRPSAREQCINNKQGEIRWQRNTILKRTKQSLETCRP